MIRVNHSAYCGMQGVLVCFDTMKEGRAYVAQRLRLYRRVFEVCVLERGKAWEILEPEGSLMVPDACGTLHLDHETFECRECGGQHETRADALHCCA